MGKASRAKKEKRERAAHDPARDPEQQHLIWLKQGRCMHCGKPRERPEVVWCLHCTKSAQARRTALEVEQSRARRQARAEGKRITIKETGMYRISASIKIDDP